MRHIAFTLVVIMTARASAQPQSPAVDADEVFAAHCAACHGTDGKARTPAGKKLGAKDLSESTLSEAEIATRILEGYFDKKGAARMPAFKDHLSAAEVASLVPKVKRFR